MIRSLNVLARLAVVAGVALSLFAVPAVAQEAGGEMPPMGRPAEMDTVAQMVGEWNVTTKMRMAPDAPWIESEAHSVTEEILDRCAHQDNFSGNFMGTPFKGIATLTYNRDRGYFENIWIDTFSARASIARGNWEGDKLVMYGDDIRMGVELKTRSTTEFVSKDEVTFLMEASYDAGKTWSTEMEMTYTRDK